MAKYSKSQKKYALQALRRIEKQLEKPLYYENEYAEQRHRSAVVVNRPTNEEILNKIDWSKTNYSEQIKGMMSIEVTMRAPSKEFRQRYKSAKMLTGRQKWSVDDFISISKAAIKGYEGSVDRVYSSIRNTVIYEKGKTEKYLAETDVQRQERLNKIYIENIQKKISKELAGAPALAEEINSKLRQMLKDNELAANALSKLAATSLGKTAIDKGSEQLNNTIANLKAAMSGGVINLQDAIQGDIISGIAEIIGYEEIKAWIAELMDALGISLTTETGKARKWRYTDYVDPTTNEPVYITDKKTGESKRYSPLLTLSDIEWQIFNT